MAAYLFNLQEWASVVHLRSNSGVDRQLVQAPVEWHSEYLRSGALQLFIVLGDSHLRTARGRNDLARLAHTRREEHPADNCDNTRTRAVDFKYLVSKLLHRRALFAEEIETAFSPHYWPMPGNSIVNEASSMER